MKTYNHLYPQITEFANLDEAWRKARRGKRTKEAAARSGSAGLPPKPAINSRPALR